MKAKERIPLHDHTDNNSGGQLSAGMALTGGTSTGGSTTTAGGAANLNDLGDVDLVTTPPADNDALTYDAASGQWVPEAVSGSSSFATPAIVLGTAAAAGAASTVIRSDSTIVAFDATVPVTQAFSDSAATGSAAFAARRDHKHGMPASPGGGGSGALVLLEQHTASASASLNFTTCISSTYDEYMIEFLEVVPATSGASLVMRMSTNAGSSYDASAIYHFGQWGYRGGGSSLAGSASQTGIFMDLSVGGGISNTATGGLSGSIKLYSPGSTTTYKRVIGHVVSWETSGSVWLGTDTFGTYQSTTAVDAFQFLMTSGNITAGIIRVYGITK